LPGEPQSSDQLPVIVDKADDSLQESSVAEVAKQAEESTSLAAPRKPSETDKSPPSIAETEDDRSDQLEQVAQQADRQTRHGFELAGRGAYFAARSEFLRAMRLVAEGLDTEHKTDSHSRALASAIIAMKEAENFLPGPGRVEANLDLPAIIAAHTTSVLKNSKEKPTSLSALRSYFTFAQEQFAVAVGHEVAGSMALHAMGKLHATMAQKRCASVVAPESKAMVFYQAALLVYPKNFMAANDLGVLLAKCGRYADAQPMLERSVALCPQSTGWRNLAIVHWQLGHKTKAEHAAKQSMSLRQTELAKRKASPTASNDMVQWVDPQAFAKTSPGAVNPPSPPAPTPAASSRTATATTPAPKTQASQRAATPAAAGRMSWGNRPYQR
jgi:tetratricopeptide (TPR) repeat protein